MERLSKYIVPLIVLVGLGALVAQALYRPTRSVSTVEGDDAYDIVTLLPKDAIPSIDNPQFYGVSEANLEYDPDELVLGVDINGEQRAYSTSHLSGHEIVNDMVGGRAIAVTW